MSLVFVYAAVFVASLLVAGTLTPVAKSLALKIDFVDQPGERKIHTHVTPYLGGVAIYIAFLVGVVLSLGYNEMVLRQSMALLGGGTILVLVGLWDDRQGMSPLVKVSAQALAAMIAIASGIRFDLFGLFWMDALLSLFWIVGLSNSINLLDNMDGLSSGSVAIASLYLFVVASTNGQFLVSCMALALMGACLGFLRYNFAPASIFMGDAGSLFLGFTLSAIALKLRLPHPPATSFLIMVLGVGLPILDTTLVTIHRMAHGRPVYLGGKDHCSHRLVALGFSRRRAVVYLYGLAGLYALGGVVLHLVPPRAMELVGASVLVGSFIVFNRLGSVDVYGGPGEGRVGERPYSPSGPSTASLVVEPEPSTPQLDS